MTLTLDDLKREYRLAGDSGDPWGTCMGVWFDIAEWLYCAGEDVPDHWHFQPGAGMSEPEPDSYWTELFREVDPDTLREFGNLLQRLSHILRAQGRDY